MRDRALAVEAAVAAECAHAQGHFREMMSALFQAQDSLGIRAWADFAAHAGIPDEIAFSRCMERPVGSFPRIQSGREIADRFGVSGTPTFWVNGKRSTASALPVAVERMIEAR